MGQEHAHREPETKQGDVSEQTPEDLARQAEIQAEGEKIKAETDELLDEVEALLEPNAEQFVKEYIQKGGE